VKSGARLLLGEGLGADGGAAAFVDVVGGCGALLGCVLLGELSVLVAVFVPDDAVPQAARPPRTRKSNAANPALRTSGNRDRFMHCIPFG
jgi:hypothetical protein